MTDLYFVWVVVVFVAAVGSLWMGLLGLSNGDAGDQRAGLACSGVFQCALIVGKILLPVPAWITWWVVYSPLGLAFVLLLGMAIGEAVWAQWLQPKRRAR